MYSRERGGELLAIGSRKAAMSCMAGSDHSIRMASRAFFASSRGMVQPSFYGFQSGCRA